MISASTNPLPDDVGVIAVEAPTSACGLGVAETISVTIQNTGTASASNFPVAYSVNGGTAVVDTFPGTLATGATASFTFAVPADLSGLGTYTLSNRGQNYSTDIYAFNDTVTADVENITPISTFPFEEDFESFAICGDVGGCNFDCSFAVANNWVQDQTR